MGEDEPVLSIICVLCQQIKMVIENLEHKRHHQAYVERMKRYKPPRKPLSHELQLKCVWSVAVNVMMQ